MKSLLLIFACTVFPCSFLYSQYYAYLNVQDPQNFAYGQGTIEEATLVITPHETYSTNDLFLTFSARGTNFISDDTVEVQLNFDMPPRSFFNDLWLWSGTDTLRGILTDIVTARATYESIVKRRRDPALLTREYNNYYRLSIFPMRGDETRKVKISYITRPTLHPGWVDMVVPLWIIKTSKNLLDHMTIITKDAPAWNNPVIVENGDIKFTTVNDPTYGLIHQVDVQSSTLSTLSTLTIRLQGSLYNTHMYVERWNDSPSSGFFNLSINPASLLQIPINRKMLFLIDHDSMSVSTDRTKSSRLNELIGALLTNNVDNDSFSVIFSAKNAPHRISNAWLSLDWPMVIDRLGASLDLETILDTIDIPGLLFDGVKFIDENGGDGDIILFASSSNLTDAAYANMILDSLKKIMNPTTRIFIVDDRYSGIVYFKTGASYYSNSFFYEQLAHQTDGDYTQYNYRSVPNFLSPAMTKVRGSLEYFDLSTTLASGFTYREIHTDLESGTLPLLDPATCIGKYIGGFPLLIEFGGIYRGQVYYKKLSVEESSIIQTDSSLSSLWAGEMISPVANYYSYDSYRQKEIVDISMSYGILSYYTAFIALEPGQSLCDTCNQFDGPSRGDVTTIEKGKQIPSSYEIIRAYPNPFNPSTTLRIQLPRGVDAKATTLIIYNVLGQEVQRFDVSQLISASPVDIVWDGKNQGGAPAPSGIYFVILTTPRGTYSVKLVLTK